MESPSSPPRPRQVTLAAWLIMAGSAMLVLMVFDRMSGLHTLETRESVQKFLAEPPGRDLGIGVEGALSIIRTVAMVAAGCATAAAILGYQVLRRSRSARVALTVLALPLFLSGMVTGGFLSSVVAAAALMLWLQPSRGWFRDGPSSLGTSSTQGFDGVSPAAHTAPTPPPAATGPERPHPGFGRVETRQPMPMPVPAGRTDPHERPAAVVWACVLTWAFTSVAIAMMLVSVAALLADPGLVLDQLNHQNPELAAQGVTEDWLRTATYVMAAIVVVWSVAAIVVAALVWRRSERARRVLVALVSAAALLLLFSTLGQVLLVVPLAASVVTLALLVRPDARAWFTGSSERS